MTRREFLGNCAKYSLLFSSLAAIPSVFHLVEHADAYNIRREWGLIKTKLSPFYTPMEGKRIRCDLCPRECVVSDGKRGYCEVRENRDGKYYSLVYGNPVTWHIDPIEKKPFFHVVPASGSFPLPRRGAISTANSVRTMRSPRQGPRKRRISICQLNWWWQPPRGRAANP